MKGKESGWTAARNFVKGEWHLSEMKTGYCTHTCTQCFSVPVWSEVNRGLMGASDTKRLLFYVTLWSYAGVTPFTSWSDNREKPHITLCPHCCFHSISTDSQPWRCEVSFKDKTLDGPKPEKKKKDGLHVDSWAGKHANTGARTNHQQWPVKWKKAGVLDGEACWYINILFRGWLWCSWRWSDRHRFTHQAPQHMEPHLAWLAGFHTWIQVQ